MRQSSRPAFNRTFLHRDGPDHSGPSPAPAPPLHGPRAEPCYRLLAEPPHLDNRTICPRRRLIPRVEEFVAEAALFVDLENIVTSLWKTFQQVPDPMKW